MLRAVVAGGCSRRGGDAHCIFMLDTMTAIGHSLAVLCGVSTLRCALCRGVVSHCHRHPLPCSISGFPSGLIGLKAQGLRCTQGRSDL